MKRRGNRNAMACITIVEELQLALRKHKDMFTQTGDCKCVLNKLISSDLLHSTYLDKIIMDEKANALNRLVCYVASHNIDFSQALIRPLNFNKL